MLGPGFPTGNRYYWKSGFLKDLSDEAIGVFVDQMAANPLPLQQAYWNIITGQPNLKAARPILTGSREFDLVVISNWPSKEGDEQT
jgi:hypothetical protein